MRTLTLLPLVLVMTSSFAQPGNPPSASSRDGHAFAAKTLTDALPAQTTAESAVRAYVDAINRQDLTAIAALLPDDHVFIDSEGNKTGPRTTMLAAWPRYFALFPDYRIQVEDVVANGRTVVVLGSWSATYAGGRGVDARVGGPAAWKAVVADGRIAVWQVYADHSRTHEVVRNAQEK